MFDFLKKKITNFIDGITKNEDTKDKINGEIKDQVLKLGKKETESPKDVSPELAPIVEAEKTQQIKEIQKQTIKQPETKVTERTISKKQEKILPSSKKSQEDLTQIERREPEVNLLPKPQLSEWQKDSGFDLYKKPQSQVEVKLLKESKDAKKEVKVGIVKQLAGLVSGEIEINRNEIIDLLDKLELEMLESDVSIEVAEQIKLDLEKKLTGAKIKRTNINYFVKNSIKETLIQLMSSEKSFDILEKVSSLNKPVKIMFFGINGSGKTTTIAKIANILIKNNYKLVFAASDTFRAAAIEQLAIHAERLGVHIIKRPYGSDPTSVAYDAINYAKAHQIDVVLIDTAGRQETDLSLVNELKKINRVIVPDIKLYVGESISGSSIVSQVKEFDKEIGIDGIILTKLDCDPKGGSVLSIAKVTRVPVVYVGIGQGYEQLEKFDPAKIIDGIME